MDPGRMDKDTEMGRLKCCPRCKGEVVVDRDHHGWYEQCLYCGYLRDFESIAETR